VGFETSLVLAQHGAKVILASRNTAELGAAGERIRSRVPGAQLDELVVDLADLASVRTAAGRIVGSETLDILINNAGVMNLPERVLTKDGFEMTFGVNHLGHFAFDALIWPAVRRALAPRVVTVSAIASSWPSAALTGLMSEQKYSPMGAYAKSKRANVVFTQELARRVAEVSSSVTPVVVHPGSAMTGLQRHPGSVLERVLTPLAARLLMGSPAGAAWPSLYAATCPDVRAGQYYGPAARDQTRGTPKLVSLPQGADGASEGTVLWELSETLTGVRFSL
jgi:NAD(P)-dependent dehydrogenase (short-subunit alcohol dehydrogenase family)